MIRRRMEEMVIESGREGRKKERNRMMKGH